MSEWKNMEINKNLIKRTTDTAVLIAMPHKSEYDGYSFWHPQKLVRRGRHAAAVSIGYTSEFVFRLKKYGHGRYNFREVLDEIPLAGDEMELILGNLSIYEQRADEPLIYTPEKIDPENATADESLIDHD